MGRTFVAFDGSDLGLLLDDDVEAALSRAIAEVDDQFTEEIASHFSGTGRAPVRTFSEAHLPTVYRAWYSGSFVRRLYICFIQVVAHLGTNPWEGLACRGEEFALQAILTQAENLAALDLLPAQTVAKLGPVLPELAEYAFDDFDFLFAFDPAADGIDDLETELGRGLGVAPLHPRHWFDQLGEMPVHPLAERWEDARGGDSEAGRPQSGSRQEPHASVSQQPTGRPLQLASISHERWFDCYLMVDWSANNSPKTGADSIWAAFGFWDRTSFIEKPAVNCPTRIEAMRFVSQVVRESLDRGLRLMVGFDFPYSYPVGMTAAATAVFGPGPQWRSVWETLASRITDDPKNKNNRFQVADDINRLTRTCFFWGRPRGYAYDGFTHLPETSEVPPGLLSNPCHRWRLVDATAGGGIKSVWQLFTAGTVGGQALTGIPHVEAFRQAFQDQLTVWPFESGVSPERTSYEKPITLVEIWPSAVSVDETLEPVRDASQVRSVVRWCAQRDIEEDWSKWLAPTTALSDEPRVLEEGWILGIR